MKKNEDSNSVLKELLIGIFIFFVLEELLLIIFFSDKLGIFLGILFGAALAAGMAVHMNWALGHALDMQPGEAEKQMLKHNIVRYLIVIIVFFIIMYTNFANPLAAFLGVMNLKVAAYLQPFTHKCIKKLHKNEEEPS